MSAVVLSLLLLLGVGAASTNNRAFWTVRIELTEDAARALLSEPRQPVKARIQFDRGRSLEVRMKLKGQGSFQRLDQKPSLTLQFDRSVSWDVPFSGSKIHLNNSVEDTSFLKEKIGADLFRRAGIAAPQVAHARLKLNERELGLYVLKEGFSEEFMLRSFGNTNGTVFDRDASDLKDDAEQMDVDAGDDARGRKKLKELWSAAHEADLDRRIDRLEKVLDVDSFLKFMAMEVLLCHWDGYVLNENNFRIYVPDDGKIQFLPSGMDQIFAKPDLQWKPRFSGRIARSVMETDSTDERYEAVLKTLFPQVMDAQQISNRITEVVREISPSLSRGEIRTVRNEAKELMTSIVARCESLRLQLQANGTDALTFTNGSAAVGRWEPIGETSGAKMTQTSSNLVIHAGPRTFASWRAEVHLAAGRYRLSSQVETRDVVPLPFGQRQGACLRVLGKNAQSRNITGTRSEALECEFQVFDNEPVVLICEVRAAGGRVQYGKPILLSQIAAK